MGRRKQFVLARRPRRVDRALLDRLLFGLDDPARTSNFSYLFRRIVNISVGGRDAQVLPLAVMAFRTRASPEFRSVP